MQPEGPFGPRGPHRAEKYIIFCVYVRLMFVEPLIFPRGETRLQRVTTNFCDSPRTPPPPPAPSFPPRAAWPRETSQKGKHKLTIAKSLEIQSTFGPQGRERNRERQARCDRIEITKSIRKQTNRNKSETKSANQIGFDISKSKSKSNRNRGCESGI